MGSIGKALFGGDSSQQQSSTKNQAYPYLQGAYAPQVASGTAANTAAGDLLGTGADPHAQDAAFANYKNSTGYQSTIQAGDQAVEDSQAAKGLAQSGSTLKRLTQFGQDTGNQYFNQYMQHLLGQEQVGDQAGQIIGGAGNQSQSTGSSSKKNGMGGFLGSVLSKIPSDPRLKMDVRHVYTAYNGLPVYDFHYIWDEPDDPFTRGYMADEVAEVVPEALAGLLAGEFITLDYNLLPPIIYGV
jgi:hypothetical protein